MRESAGLGGAPVGFVRNSVAVVVKIRALFRRVTIARSARALDGLGQLIERELRRRGGRRAMNRNSTDDPKSRGPRRCSKSGPAQREHLQVRTERITPASE